MRTGIKVALAIVTVIIIAIAAGVITFSAKLKQSEKIDLTVSDIDLTKAKDGTYTADCEAFPNYAKVEVTIQGNKIAGIKLLEHRNGKGGAAEVLPSKVVEAQSVQVDTISGATLSSKLIRKAIRNALTKAVPAQ